MKTKLDKFLVLCSCVYVTLPVIIFAFGWLKHCYSVPFVIVASYFMFRLYRELVNDAVSLFNSHDDVKFWIITSCVIALWVCVSGIGSFMYQNGDFAARNPLYHDLCNYEWPVVYDFTLQNAEIQSIMGSSQAAMSYYFSYWLPPAFIVKVLSLGYAGQELCLYAWSVLGVFLVAYNLCRLFRKNSYVILIVLIFFSGIDLVGYLLQLSSRGYKGNFVLTFIVPHIEWWAKSFQYSSNTGQLFWVFNQSIETWLITSILLQLRTAKNSAALGSLTFAYSSWATLGIVPLALASGAGGGRKLTQFITLQNILLPLGMLIVYGTFYASGNAVARISESGFTITSFRVFLKYLLFVMLEFGVYFMLLGREARRYKFYYVVLVELLVFPTYNFITRDSIMRCSIPALFVLMTFVMRFLLESSPHVKLRKYVLVAALVLGSYTPLCEINRSVGATTMYVLVRHNILPRVHYRKLIRDEIHSLGKVQKFYKFIPQYYIYDYKTSPFFRYLAR